MDCPVLAEGWSSREGGERLLQLQSVPVSSPVQFSSRHLKGESQWHCHQPEEEIINLEQSTCLNGQGIGRTASERLTGFACPRNSQFRKYHRFSIVKSAFPFLGWIWPLRGVFFWSCDWDKLVNIVMTESCSILWLCMKTEHFCRTFPNMVTAARTSYCQENRLTRKFFFESRYLPKRKSLSRRFRRSSNYSGWCWLAPAILCYPALAAN